MKYPVRTLRTALIALISALCVNFSAFAGPIWGSLDASRMSRPLTGTGFTQFNNTITGSGGTVTSASSITSGYLAGVDVFFYGWAGTNAGVLSASEQTALGDFVSGGGTFIATSDIYSLASINSATGQFGMTHTYVGHGGTYANAVSAHAITQGVTQAYYNTESTFSLPGNAQVLFNNPDGDVFMAVMDASTGYTAGQILVMGDHNILADYQNYADNAVLYQNIVDWAASANVPEPASIAIISFGLLAIGIGRRRVAPLKVIPG